MIKIYKKEKIMDNTIETKKTRVKKILLIIGGTVSLGLGILGIFLPLLPTTPFLLLSAACYLRSSRKMYVYVTEHKVFGKYIKNYEKGVMEKKDKYRTLILLWIGILFSAWMIDKNIMRVVLILIAIGVTIHLNCLKSV